MSEKQEAAKKLNKLAIDKETISDLDVNNASEVRGGATFNQSQTEPIRCNIAPKTLIGNPGSRCDTSRVQCPNQY